MKWLVLAAGSVAALAGLAILPGCALQCGASEQKLASLRPGMSYTEAAQIMGCPGRVTTANNPDSDAYASVEWNGPKDFLFTRTQLDFLAGRLLSYTTDKRGAL
jgi:hypothetical protein